MPFVIDASVAANWLLPDEEDEAEEAWRRIESDPALVPQHWWFEIRNVLLMAERRQRISELATTALVERLSRLRITTTPPPDDVAVFAIARRRHLTFYDAAYLELARQHDVPIATLDRRLAAAATAEKVAVLGRS